ncbi:MAG: HDOD domain-containing protein [Burkholderiaceae bacterium]
MAPMERLFENAKALPSIPRVLHEVIATLNKENFATEELTRPLEQDPTLLAKVLRMANSAHYRQDKSVASIDDALLVVGEDAVRTLVIASGLMGSFSAIPGFDMQRFWRLSLLSAYLARDMARRLKLAPDMAYTAALMHGLGILSIHSVFPEEALAIDKVCETASPAERATQECAQLGFHHGEAGAEIVCRWKLPSDIGGAIRDYATPLVEGASPLAGLVHCAVALAIDLQDDVAPDAWGARVDGRLNEQLGIDWDGIRYRADSILKHRETADATVS